MVSGNNLKKKKNHELILWYLHIFKIDSSEIINENIQQYIVKCDDYKKKF